MSTVKNIFTPAPVVYATDRSKAAVPVSFLFYVALRFILSDASCFGVFPCYLSSCSVILLSTVIGEEESDLCASRAFVYLFCTC